MQPGHNEKAIRLAALAGDAQIALDRITRGEADAVDGWLAYGAALNEGRALFPGDREFGQWVHENVLGQLAQGAVEPKEQQAAMWAAANADQLAEAKASCNARTLRGWHDQWKKIEKAREEERRKAEREAEEARRREESQKAEEEAAALAKVEADARAAARAADTEEERQEAEAEADQAATARAEAEQVVAAAEAVTEAAPDPLAEYRKGLSSLTREGLEDEVAGLRADLAETKAKLKQARDEARKLKEQNADFTGDSATVVRRMQAEITRLQSAVYRANEKFDAEHRLTYRLKKELKAALDELGQQEIPL